MGAKNVKKSLYYGGKKDFNITKTMYLSLLLIAPINVGMLNIFYCCRLLYIEKVIEMLDQT